MKFKNIWENQGENLCDWIDDETLMKIGRDCYDQYKIDRESRMEWETQYAESLEIANQYMREKTFPWPNAANVRYPLVAMACVQYNARSYASLLSGETIVRPRYGEKEEWDACKRIDSYIRDEMYGWEESLDRLLMVQSLVGNPVKKTYRSREVHSELVLPDRYVVNYYAKDRPHFETHRLYYEANEVVEAKRSGFFRDVEIPKSHLETTVIQTTEDKAVGVKPPTEPQGHEILECHCWIDLDEDGYEEPYIVHLESTSRVVLRISPRFEEIYMSNGRSEVVGYDPELEKAKWKISSIKAERFFTKFTFIPSFDGSWYDIGFGVLLGPVNRAVDTLMNQLIDAGTLANTSGGLVARNVRVRSGRIEIIPGKFVRTEANAEDLARGIFPWPMKEPSQVLFALMQFLLQSGERLGSVTDAMTGENPGQNQAATTTMAVIEQGSQVLNSIYKRTYRALTEEVKLIHKHLVDMDDSFGVRFELTADKHVMTNAQRIMKAEALVMRTEMKPHLYGPEGEMKAERMYLDSLQINSENLLMDQPQPKPQDPRLAKEQADAQFKAQEFQHRQQKEAKELALKSTQTTADISEKMARIRKMEADAAHDGKKLDLEKEKMELEDARERALVGRQLDKQPSD